MKFLILILICFLAASPITSKQALAADNAKALTAATDSADVSYKIFIRPYKPTYFLIDPDHGHILFQISFKHKPFKSLKEGGNKYLNKLFLHRFNVQYSQKSWWDVSSQSLPFIETNYNPGVFFDTPEYYFKKDRWAIMLEAGAEHESNGLEGIKSRSWNRFYIEPKLTFRWHKIRNTEIDSYEDSYRSKLSFSFRYWQASNIADDNRDIKDYQGYGELKIDFKKKYYNIIARGRHGKKSFAKSLWTDIILDLPYFEPHFMIHGFTGYGERLTRYNERDKRLAVGFILFMD